MIARFRPAVARGNDRGVRAAGPPATVVIGLGNPFRRDDGVATTVLDRVGPTLTAAGVRCRFVDGDPAALIDAWAGAGLAIVIDAVRAGDAPGTVHRIELGPGIPHAPAGVSSHLGGVAEALALAGVLDRLPARLLLVGVEGADFSVGVGLSAPVAAAVPALDALVRSAAIT